MQPLGAILFLSIPAAPGAVVLHWYVLNTIAVISKCCVNMFHWQRNWRRVLMLPAHVSTQPSHAIQRWIIVILVPGNQQVIFVRLCSYLIIPSGISWVCHTERVWRWKFLIRNRFNNSQRNSKQWCLIQFTQPVLVAYKPGRKCLMRRCINFLVVVRRSLNVLTRWVTLTGHH